MNTTNKGPMTGHYDCCGQMISEGDTVVVKHGQDHPIAHVIWIDSRWMLRFSDGSLEALNRHGKNCIRRVQQ